MNYKKSYQNDKSFLSLTSLYPEEFDYLLPTFSQEWSKYHKHFDMLGKRRKAPKISYKNDTKTLPKVEDKLFFILVYLKNNPLQEFIACSFEIDQSHACRWIKILSDVLGNSLKQLDVLPCQDGSALKSFLSNKEIDCLIIDAVEQRTVRAIDTEVQAENYSGKKKTIV
jgi:hypothetical protein